MANEHPFQHLFETLGRTPHSHAESVNRQAYEVLSDILSVPVEKSGRCILLRAARAGHGKTHLLSRIQHQMGATHEFIPLHAGFGCRIDAGSVIDDTLRRLVKQLPASGGLCVLDLVARRLFASALQPLVGSGEVPCQDREGALAALRLRPIETFDFHHPNAVTAHWARENFEVLGQRLSLELAQRAGLPVREVAFWVEALFRFAAAPLENSNRVRVLADTVHDNSGGEMERLEALLGLVTQLMRVVLVADDLEGFSSDETAALRFAAFLGTLRHSVDRLDVILSLNLDIWQSAFVPRLSGGLADRLSEVVVELEPLKDAEIAALLDSRVPGLGAKVLERIDVGSSGRHARGLIRAAGMAWLKATAVDSAEAAPAAPVLAPAPVEVPIPQAAPSQPAFIVPEPAPAPSPEPVVEEVAPAVAAAAAAFAAEPEPPAVIEPEPAWPAPEFAPPAPVALEPEPSPFQTQEPEVSPESANVPAPQEPVASVPETPVVEPPVESPFQVSPPEPAPEPAAAQAPVESPFQASGNEPFTFNPPPSDPFPQPDYSPFEDPPQQQAVPQPAFQPQVDSPFQSAPAEQASVEPAASSGFIAQPAFQPFTNSPFQPAFTPPTETLYAQEPNFQPQADTAVHPKPTQYTAAEPAPQEPNRTQGGFQPSAESPFQAAPTQFAAEPTPQEPVQPQSFFQPAAESPFQAAPAQFTAEPAPQQASFQPVVESPFQPAVESPFQAAPQTFVPAEPAQVFQPAPESAPAQPFQAAPEPAPAQASAPAEATPAAAPSDTDRVDDLLRQFRERYGRGSL